MPKDLVAPFSDEFQPLRIGLIALILSTVVALPISADEPKTPELSYAESLEASEPQIVGGDEVSNRRWRRNYRFMVALETPTGFQFCGGSLIDPEWVLTAAHCLPGQTPQTMRIHVGTPVLSNGGTIVEVAGLIPHPLYNPSTQANDLALIRLATPVDNLPIVELADADVTDDFAAPRMRVRGIGWGTTSEGGSPSDRLREVRLPVIPNGRCRQAYPDEEIRGSQICAGRRAGGVDTCQGDSGGPLLADTDTGLQQVGIVSWGYGCARPDLYGVYTRVANYLDWIDAVLGGSPACIERGLSPTIRRPRRFECFGLPNNDDSSTNPVLIGFPIQLGGQMFTSLFVNNNGNLTFESPMNTYTPLALVEVPRPVIAPFFADVDTRGAESRIVYYGQGRLRGRRTFSAIWQRIGYYSRHSDRLNTFQVVLTEDDPVGAGNFTIEFNYGPIQWETGDASDGEGGLGGYSARVGFSMVEGVPDFAVELDGGGVPGSFIDGGPESLSANSNVDIPGRFRWSVVAGAVR